MLSLSPTSIDEDGDSSAVTASLSSKSSAVTTVTVSASGPSGSYSQSGTTLTIPARATASTTASTVTITAVDNDVDEPDRSVTVSGSASNTVGVTGPASKTLTIEDDDATPTVTLSLSPSSIDEDGGTSTVTASLSGKSSAVTTVTVSSGVSGSYNQSGTTLTIAAGATASTGTVTITAVDDDLDEPDRSVTVSGSASNTVGVTGPASKTLTIEDDDTDTAPQITGLVDDQSFTKDVAISTLQLPTATGGNGTLSYSISPALPTGLVFDPDPNTLTITGTPTATQPATTYTYTVSDSDGNTADVDRDTLTFSITVQEDAPTLTGPITDQSATQGSPYTSAVAFPEATGVDGTVSYSVTPALPAGLTFDAAVRKLTGTPTAYAATASYTYTATDDEGTASDPSDDTTATLTFDLEVIAATPTAPTLTATAGDKEVALSWSGGGAYTTGWEYRRKAGTGSYGSWTAVAGGAGVSAKTVDGLANDTAQAFEVRAVNGAGDAVKGAASAEQTATPTLDAPAFGVPLSPLDRTYTLQVPIAKFPLPAASGGNGTLVYSLSPSLPAGLTFDAANRQITGTPTATQAATTYTYKVADSDGNTADADTDTLTFSLVVTAPAVTVTPASGLTVAEGSTGTFGVVLAGPPSADVTVTPTSSDTAVATVGGPLTFTPSNWSSGQTVTVTGEEDADADDGTTTVLLSITGASEYGGLTDPQVTVTVTDDDELPGVPTVFSAAPGNGQVALSWVLPTNTTDIDQVQVRWKATANLPFVDATDSWTDLTATATTYTATGLTNGTLYTFEVRATNPAGHGTAAATQSTPTSSATLQILPSSLEVAEGASDTFTVALANAPSGPVTVTVTSDDTDVTVSPASLTFTTTDYATAQTVTVNMASNPTDGTATLSLSASGGGYGGVTGSVAVTSTSQPSFGTETVADQSYTQDTAIATLTLPVATGGDGTLTYALSPTAPTGLTFDASARTLTGTPTASQAAVEYTYTATDADGDEAQLTFDLRVAATLTVGGVADADQAENAAYTATATLTGTPVGSITWTLSGNDGDDFALSNQSDTGATVTLTAQDYETPADADTDNVYDYTLTATDSDNNTGSADISITVTDVIETATLTLTGLADGVVDENSDFTDTATLANAVGAVTWTLGGDDADEFALSDTGATAATVTLASPDYENPSDANADNVYHYTLTATDADGNTVTSDTVDVTVNDVVEMPAKPSGFAATAGDTQVTLTWTDPGDATITKYQVRYKAGTDFPDDDPTTWGDIAGSGASTVTHTVTGLTNDTGYVFQIRAVNSAGVGAESDAATATPEPPSPPDRPTGLSAAAGDGGATLTWDDPGDASITHYRYQQWYRATSGNWVNMGWVTIAGSGASTVSHDVTGLTNGTQYRFRLRAYNALGSSPQSNWATVTPTPPPPPAKPTGFDAEAGDTQVTLTWTDPVDATITKYQVRYKAGTDFPDDDATAWGDIAGSGASTTSHDVTGLTNGTQYVFQVRAVNSGGEGAKSDAETATPVLPPAPAKPVGFAATAGDTQVTLTWSDPVDATITKYQVRYKAGSDFPDDDATAWGDIAGSGASTVTHDVTGLTNGTQYVFQVRAVNSGGEGAKSDAETATPAPPPAPAKPVGFAATAGDTQVTLTWSDPVDATITKYQVRYKAGTDFPDDDATAWGDITGSGASTVSHTVTGLTNDTGYVFQIRAVNSTGEGAKSDAATATPEPPSPPDRPTGLSAAAGDGGATLTWDDPGDASITHYRYEQWSRATSGSWVNMGWVTIAGSGASTVSHDVTGLTNGTQYRFRLRAHNTLGSSLQSNWTTVTPVAPPAPAKPVGFAAVAGDTQVTLTWTDPVDATITKYQVRYKAGTDFPDDDATAWGDIAGSGASTVTHDVTGLTNGTQYVFQVRAVNSGGEGAKSDAETATRAPPPAPAKPVGFAAVAGDTQVTLTWTDPVDATITKYQVRYKAGSDFPDDDATAWGDITGSGASTVTHDVTGLTNGTQYVFQVRAVNSGGEGAKSDAATATPEPPSPPDRPTGLSAAAGDGGATLTWDDPGDASITHYRYEQWSRATSGSWVNMGWVTIAGSGASTVSHDVTGLTNGTQYRFRLRAYNALGSSLQSNWATVTPVAPPTPAKPVGFAATAGDTQVTLTWTDPGDTTITKYQVRYKAGTDFSDDDATVWGDITGSGASTVSHDVTGLTNGTQYVFQVRAVNSIGAGTKSDAETATPAAVPAKPSGFAAVAGDTQVTLTWTDPGDTTITKYQVRYKAGSDFPDDDATVWGDITGSGASTVTHDVTGLTNGTEYVFQVRAVNSVGDGAKSDAETATPEAPSVPDRPTGLSAAAGDGGATLTWDDPGNANINYYRYEQWYRATSGSWVNMGWVTITGSGASTVSHDVTGLTNGTQYRFRLRAYNALGNSPSSSWATATPTAPASSLSVTAAQAQEGPGVTVDFKVTLAPAAASAVTVDYATSDGTALSGQDYTAATGTLTFAAGETSKTVSVAVIDDAVDEGDETFTLTLSAASGATISTAVATGTISNADPLPQAWLTRFGRAVAGHVVDGVGERLLRTESPTPHVRFAGVRVDLGDSDGRQAGVGALPSHGLPAGTGWTPGAAWGPSWTGGGPGGTGAFTGQTPAGGTFPAHALSSTALSIGATPPSGRYGTRPTHYGDLLLNSSFAFATGGEEDTAPAWTFWGQGAGTRFDGGGDEVRVDGDVRTYLMGADTQRGRWLAGAALSLSEGAGGYETNPHNDANGPERGGLASSLTGIHPYARYAINERLSAWGTAGYATGETTLNREDAGHWTVDTSLRMAAAGLRGVLRQAGPDGGVELAVRADAMWTAVESEGVTTQAGRLAGSQGATSRLRLILEGSRAFAIAGGRALTPSLELGLRRDGGDAETGAGLELGGGVRFADPGLGLAVELKARGLVSHSDAQYREWGAGASVRFDPGVAGKGLRLELAPSWGTTQSGGAERLWSQTGVADLFGSGRQGVAGTGRMDAELGYAMDGPRGKGLQTPFAALSSTDGGDRALRLG